VENSDWIWNALIVSTTNCESACDITMNSLLSLLINSLFTIAVSKVIFSVFSFAHCTRINDNRIKLSKMRK
jgi:hypothetical protein